VDWTQAGEWIAYEGEFGTSSWRSTLNPPEGIVLPQMGNVVLESSNPNQQSGGTGIKKQISFLHIQAICICILTKNGLFILVVLGNTVPLTFLDSDHRRS
jgi:hypothetical protein